MSKILLTISPCVALSSMIYTPGHEMLHFETHADSTNDFSPMEVYIAGGQH